MNTLNYYWAGLKEKVEGHFDRYDQLPQKDKKDVQLKTFSAALGGGVIGSCFSPKVAPVGAAIAGVATFAYLTQKKEVKNDPVSQFKYLLLPTPSLKPEIIERWQLTARQGLPEPIRRLKVTPVSGLAIYGCSSLVSEYQKTSVIYKIHITESKGTQTEVTKVPENIPKYTQQQQPAKSLPENDWEFEKSVYQMEMNGLMEKVHELEEELNAHRAIHDTPELPDFEHEVHLLKQHLREEKQHFALADQQWIIREEDQQQTIEKQKIQIAQLSSQVDKLKKQGHQNSSIILELKQTNENLLNKLENVDKLKRKNQYLMLLLNQKNNLVEEQKNEIDSLKENREALCKMQEENQKLKHHLNGKKKEAEKQNRSIQYLREDRNFLEEEKEKKIAKNERSRRLKEEIAETRKLLLLKAMN